MSEPSLPEEFCACGRRLHYPNSAAREAVERLIENVGEFVIVRVGDRRWFVQRHYIALHGLKAVELPGLGFVEVE